MKVGDAVRMNVAGDILMDAELHAMYHRQEAGEALEVKLHCRDGRYLVGVVADEKPHLWVKLAKRNIDPVA